MDPLDNFDEKINRILDGKTSGDIDLVYKSFNEKREFLEKEIFDLLVRKTNQKAKNEKNLETIKSELDLLQDKINSIKLSLSKSDLELKTVFGEIRTLDTAKNNLSQLISAMTKISSLEFLSSKLQNSLEKQSEMALDNLGSLETENETNSREKNYKEATNYFKAIFGFFDQLQFFKNNLVKLNLLKEKTKNAKNFFVDQIYEDFGRFKASKKGQNEHHYGFLKAGCELLESVDDDKSREKAHLCDWIVEIHLQKYENLLLQTKTLTIEEAKKHFSFYKKMLKDFEKYKPAMPQHWEISFQITWQFFNKTYTKYSQIFVESVKEMTIFDFVEFLNFVFEFEKQIELFYKKKLPKKLSKILMSHSDRYVTAEKNKMSAIIEAIGHLNPNEIYSNKNKKMERIGQIDSLFHFIKKEFLLYKTIKSEKIFSQFIEECLKAIFNLMNVVCRISDNISKTWSKKIEQISEERPLEMLTLILKTTSYIEEIVLQLKKRIFKDCQKINFKTDFDFHKLEEINIKLANNTLNNISDLINEKCEPILRETNKLNLAKLKTLGEPSRFTEALSVIIERKFVILRQNLVTEHYLIFCGRFLAKFYQIFNDFIQNCRMVRKIGAQQLLLDHYTIKSHIQRNILSSDEQTSDNLLKKIILAKSENLEKKLKLLSSEEFSVKKFCQFFPTFGKTELKKILSIKFGDSADTKKYYKDFETLNKN